MLTTEPTNRTAIPGSAEPTHSPGEAAPHKSERPNRPVAWVYTVAVLAVTVAAAIQIALGALIGKHLPLLLFCLAIMVASRFGGRDSGLTATVLGLLATWLLYLPPRFGLVEPVRPDLASLTVFVAVGVSISFLGGQLQDAVDSAKESEETVRALLESAAQGIIGTTKDGRIAIVNAMAERLFGYRRTELLGKKIEELIPERLRERHVGLRESFTTSPRIRAMGEASNLFARRKDGSTFPVEISLSWVHTRRGTMIVSLITDITQRRQAETEIRKLNDELEERVRTRTMQLEATNKELEAFSYSVSHDLRAPLRSIDGWSLALDEDYGPQLDETARKYLSRVRSESQHMGRLIDDLLKLSRVSRSPMTETRVDLTDLANRIVSHLRENHADRQVDFDAEPGLTAAGDPGLLEIALTNMLSNSWKFTGPREPAKVEFGRCEVNGTKAFFIRDNGVGFDMAYADTLFGAFQRMHKASEFPGTGIGLATVQRIVHRHGGRVWAEGKPEQGATFYFTLRTS